jgi:hypothetical protein
MLLEFQALALSQLGGNSVIAGSKALYDAIPAEIEKGFAAAAQELVANAKLLKDEPFYYGLRMDIAARRGAPDSEITDLYTSAQKQMPDYFMPKYQALLWLAEHWKYDPAKVDALISDAASVSRAQNGDGDYADLYWWVYAIHSKRELFTEMRASWPRMRRGMDDRIKRYRGATNANRYALLACLAGDQKQAKRMFEIAGQTIDPEVWEDQLMLYQCWYWAMEGRGEPLGKVADFDQRPALTP